ncbi:Mu transposase C-terminal domain-containing protein [Tardiphaga sp. 172_B4_N1_3]|uniref:Mu transposase C-terminal domain-containing protein n=1 Tax=Tardiphaga sp. 172_B4_N1_3 TaxID=3240787 RepID=UPI003F8989E1
MKIIINPHDRIILKNSERRVVEQNPLGYILVRAHEKAELREELTHKQIKELIDAGEMSIDRNWYESGRANARLLAGVNTLSDLPAAEVFEMRRREYFVTNFLKREAADKAVKRTDECIKDAIAKIEEARPKLEAHCNRPNPDEWPKRPSARSLRRWLKQYENHGASTLALRNKYRFCGNRISNMDPEMLRVLIKHAVSYCSLERPGVNLIYKTMQAEIAALNVEREANGLPRYACPGKETLSRKIKSLNAFEVYASRNGIADARTKFAMVSGGLDVTRPLQHVQIDEWTIQLHTIASALGLDELLTEEDRKYLQTQRLKVCLILDVATRCVLGFRISSRSDHQTAIATLAMAVTDKNSIAAAAGCKSDWPMQGPPSLASPDAGSMFLHEAFHNVLATCGIVYENAPAGLSHLRGHVERVFGTMHTSLMPHFTGRSFSNVVDKGEYKAEERASIFSAQLPQIFTRWVVDVYHHTPHSGLEGKTPYNAWKDLVEEFGVNACPTPHQRRNIFGVELDRVLDQSGVVMAGNQYHSKELHAWYEQVGSCELKVRFDASDIGHVSVWFGNGWNAVPSVREGLRGMDLHTWTEIVTDLKRRHQAGARVNEHIVHAAIRDIAKMAKHAMHVTAISADRPTKEELNHVEATLALGFKIVSDQASSTKPAGDILGSAFPAAHDDDQPNTSAVVTADATAPTPLPSITPPGADDPADEAWGDLED